MALLQVENIKKRFGNTQVLKGVSFSLERGQVLVIIGSSGSGKTTLLRCLNFLESPDEGEITVDGKKLFSAGLLIFTGPLFFPLSIRLTFHVRRDIMSPHAHR